MAKITPTDAARQLGITPSRVIQLIKSQELPCERYGARGILIEEADLDLVRSRATRGRRAKNTSANKEQKPPQANEIRKRNRQASLLMEKWANDESVQEDQYLSKIDKFTKLVES